MGNPDLVFIVPGACVNQVRQLGVAEDWVLGAKAGQALTLPGLAVFPVSAAHPVHSIDQNGEDLALSYFLESICFFFPSTEATIYAQNVGASEIFIR